MKYKHHLVLGGVLLAFLTPNAARAEQATKSVGGPMKELQRLSRVSALSKKKKAPKKVAKPLGRLGDFGNGKAITNFGAQARMRKRLQAATFKRQREQQKLAKLKTPKTFDNPWGGKSRLQGGRVITDYSINQADALLTSDLWPGGFAGTDVSGATKEQGLWEITSPRTTHQEFAGGGGSRAQVVTGQSTT